MIRIPVDLIHMLTDGDLLRIILPQGKELKIQVSADGSVDLTSNVPLLLENTVPIPMILHCPACHLQHIDAPEPETGWTNPPHKSHLCHGCGIIWRPAAVETVGVGRILWPGNNDTWPREKKA